MLWSSTESNKIFPCVQLWQNFIDIHSYAVISTQKKYIYFWCEAEQDKGDHCIAFLEDFDTVGSFERVQLNSQDCEEW